MLIYFMYSLKGKPREKYKRKIITAAFANVILAEISEFFVPKNENTSHSPHLEMPEHVPEEGKKNPAQKKPKQPQFVHSNQTKNT